MKGNLKVIIPQAEALKASELPLIPVTEQISILAKGF